MSSRSLKVAPQHIQRVNNSLKRNSFPSQQAFAKEMGVSRDTVSKFLRGIAIDCSYFIEFCDKLGLDWQEIADNSEDIPDDPNFVGRENAIAAIKTLTQNHRLILIHAAGGIGKTELAKRYLKNQGFELIIELLMAKDTQNVSSVEGIVEEWIQQDFKQEPARDFAINLTRLTRLLKERRVGILIDNLEPALKNGKFIEQHRSYIELLRVLADPDVKSMTLITSREKLAESAISIGYYSLEGLTEEAWKEYFNYQNINIDQYILKAMRDAYGGNAKAMTILCGAIREDYDGDMIKYWQDNQSDLLVKLELKDLVATQFNQLKKTDITAYNLLCRLGCYRFQDVPTIPVQGLLCLLWNVESENQLGVIEQLKNRSLFEHKSGEYWLHPVIKQKAVSILKSTEDWEIANRKAAEFWTESVKEVNTVEDALKALEAYYHYFEIKDYEEAAAVLTKERENNFTNYELLMRSFYRLALVKKILPINKEIISKLAEGENLALLYNNLGVLYRIIGELEQAIKHQKKSKEIAINCNLQEGLKILPDVNIVICKIELEEKEEALTSFLLLINTIDKNSIDRLVKYLIECSYFCLPFLYSSLGNLDAARDNLKKIEDIEKIANLYGWGKYNKYLFVALTHKNLGEIDTAFEQYETAIKVAEKNGYQQVKAKALTGIGELYRIQKEYNTAIKHHNESIEILEEIGAKCDLAEAYYQLALTYQDMNQPNDSQEYFTRAIDLFNEIEAPKQVERVRESIINIVSEKD